MMDRQTKHGHCASLIFAASLVASPVASADAVCDWNIKAGEFVVSARMGPPPANRAIAIANTAVYEAVNAITKRYPAGALTLDAAPAASVDAAIAAANRTALFKLLPSQQSAIDALVVGTLAVGAVSTARAADEPTIVVVRFFPAEGREDEAQARLVKLAKFVPANNPGVTFRLHRSIKKPVVFLLHETFPSQAALDTQQKTVLPAFLKEFGATPEGMWAKLNEVEMYRITGD